MRARGTGLMLLGGLLCLLPALPGQAGQTGQAQKFYPDDPIQQDHDDLPIEKPTSIELRSPYDVIENSFVNKVERPIPRAVNVNTFGEVPDSSWFTNRIGVRPMSIEELVRGPNRVGGPDLSEPVTIISGKVGGITPGLGVRDRRGNVYFLKFDPRARPNLSTGAAVIGKRVFHAVGYNVPENHITYLRIDDFTIQPGAEVALSGGRRGPPDREAGERRLDGSGPHPERRLRARRG